MSFIIKWDADQIVSDLRLAAGQVGSAYNDGFSAWMCKQDLLKVKYALDDMLSDLPTFAGEKEYCEKLEQEKTWKILKRQQ